MKQNIIELIRFAEETSVMYPWSIPADYIINFYLEEIEIACDGDYSTDSIYAAIDKVCGPNPQIKKH